MRLRQVQATLREAIGKLQVRYEEIGGNVRLTGWKEAHSGVEQIKAAGILKNIVGAVLAVDVVTQSVQDPIVVSVDIGRAFNNALTELRQRATTLLKALDETLPEESEESVSFKLPDSSSLQEVSKDLDRLETILSQIVVNDYLKGEVRLLNFDRGSNWIEVYLGSIVAVKFLGGLVRIYFEIRQRQIQLRTLEAAADDLVSDVDLRKKLRENTIKRLEEEYETKMETHIQNTSEIPTNDHEYKARVKVSMHMLGEMLNRGLEIHPALTAPVEVKNNFPNPLKLLETIKQLPQGGTDAEETTREPGKE